MKFRFERMLLGICNRKNRIFEVVTGFFVIIYFYNCIFL